MTKNTFSPMVISNEKAEEMYLNSEKQMLRRQLPKELMKYIGDKAYEDFGSMDRTAVGKELTKLILVAKDVIEKDRESLKE
jgi:hypothetical protein